MNRILILLFTFSTLQCFSQKRYEFDHIIEYRLIVYKDSLVEKSIPRFYITNSKQNNFLAVITDLDSLNYRMDFIDYNLLSFNVNFLKTKLNRAEFINVGCKFIRGYQSVNSAKTKEYAFSKLKDTVINEIEYDRYKLYSINPKREKRKKIGTEVYIVEKSTEFHLPIFYLPLAYQEWKSAKNIPFGIFKERLSYDYFGKLKSKEVIIEYSKIDKKVIISEDCDYTQNN